MALTVAMGSFFGIFFGAFFAWSQRRVPVAGKLSVAIGSGLLFGLSMAIYYRWKAARPGALAAVLVATLLALLLLFDAPCGPKRGAVRISRRRRNGSPDTGRRRGDTAHDRSPNHGPTGVALLHDQVALHGPLSRLLGGGHG